MINAEKLLGKVLSEIKDAHFNNKKKQKKQKKKDKKKNKKNKNSQENYRSDDMLSGLAGKLMSGKGLLAAVAVGVGAYTIVKGKKASEQQLPPPTPQIPNNTPQAQAITAPPIPVPSPSSRQGDISPQSPQAPTVPTELQKQNNTVSVAEQPEAQELALRMIQVMIAAAYADGQLDNQEEKEILTRLREADLNSEEKGYILSQFHAPKSIEELSAGVNEPHICQAMYSLAVSSIVIDNEKERQWLDDLAHALGLSKEMQNFIEE